MKLPEEMTTNQVLTTALNETSKMMILAVPGGWIYTLFIDGNIMQPVYVPNHAGPPSEKEIFEERLREHLGDEGKVNIAVDSYTDQWKGTITALPQDYGRARYNMDLYSSDMLQAAFEEFKKRKEGL